MKEEKQKQVLALAKWIAFFHATHQQGSLRRNFHIFKMGDQESE